MFPTNTNKGLAGAAVGALALAGLPLLAGPASAVTHSSTLGNDEVDLVAPVSTTVSGKPDGQNSTMRLTAIGGTNVTGVKFEYRIGNGSWTEITTQTSRNDDGAFAAEWNPAAIAGSTNVTLRATGLGTTTPDTDDLTGVSVDNNAATVNVTDASTLNVFQAPYSNDADAGQFAAVEGTASAPGATPTLDFYDPSADAFAGHTDPSESTTAQGASTGTWRGVLDITGYDYGTGSTDQVLVKAVGAAGSSDDSESFTINRQQLGSVTAEPTSSNVPGNGTKKITITVLDGAGTPVAGAEVRREGGAYVGQTDAQGKVTADQAGGTQAYYYANATDSDAYESGLGDKKSATVSVGQYDPAPASLEASSANGAVFDYDEYDADDISVQVKDQEGEDVPFGQGALQTVDYTWTFAAYDGNPTARKTTGTTQVGLDGSADIPMPPNQSEGGTYTLEAGLQANPATGSGAIASKKVLTVDAGEAVVTFDDDEVAGAAGSSAVVSGTLALDGGPALPGRPMTLTYAADGNGNAAFDQPSGADAATRTVTTGDDGSFSATLDDPATQQDQPTETGTVTAATDAYQDPNTPVDQDDADADGTTDVTFFNDAAPAGAKVDVTGLQGTGKPGAPSYGTATVTDAQGQPVPNVAVKLSVDGDSFFTNGPANGTVGQPAGDLQERGQAITLVTDADGTVSFAVGIERSEDFDDDGKASDTVTAKVGDTTDTADVAWSSADPLNGGEVRIDLADDSFQESGVLPKAPITDDVAYDVKVTDQFGNLVGGEDVAISSDGGDVVDTAGDPLGGNDTVVSDFDADPEFELSSDSQDDVTPTGTWDANTSVYAADSTGPGGDADDDADIVTTDGTDRVTGDGPTAQFYEVDWAGSTYTLTQQGAEQRDVGDTVIMTYAATDQNGEPIEFDVAFFRTGPGNDDDGSADDRVATGEDGTASYVFSGNTAGTARVSAIGYDGNKVISESQVSDTVQFGEVSQPGDPIEILLAGDSNGPKKDIVRASVDESAAGETIKLFVIRGTKAQGNKRLKQVRQDIVPEDGQLTFKKADRNGNRKTRYIAKVTRGGTTNKSNTQKIR